MHVLFSAFWKNQTSLDFCTHCFYSWILLPARYSFEWARANGRKKVTLIHKANIMKVTDGLFLEVSGRVAKDFPDIKHEQMIIDNCCMQLVSNPWQFDVMILTNL